jgi:hypothetical protein
LPFIEDALAVRERGPEGVVLAEFSLSSSSSATAKDCLRDDEELPLALLLPLRLLLLLASFMRDSRTSRKVSPSCDGTNPLLGEGNCSVAISSYSCAAIITLQATDGIVSRKNGVQDVSMA